MNAPATTKTKKAVATESPASLPVSVEAESMSMIERILTNCPTIDPANLEKMVALQTQILDRNAKQAFASSMSMAQEEMSALSIVKQAENSQTSSKYARLGAIIRAISPIYTKHGLALSFGSEEAVIAGTIRIVCDVSHELGFEKRYTIDMPLDGQGIQGKVNKTGPHAFGSSVSYARRYLTTMIFNLAILDEEDVDGNGPELISAQQVTDLHNALGKFVEHFCRDWNINSLVELWADNFDEAMTAAQNIRQTPITDYDREALKQAASEAGSSIDAVVEASGTTLEDFKRGHLPRAFAYFKAAKIANSPDQGE